MRALSLEENKAIVRRFLVEGVIAGNLAVIDDASAEWQSVAIHKARIEEWLSKKRPLRLSKVHTLLVREHGFEASYDTLRRYVIGELGWRKKAPTIRIDDPPPGQEAQIDFGKMGPMLDPVLSHYSVEVDRLGNHVAPVGSVR